MPGTLFVVATPIGNLEDLTFRALRVLGEVDLIAAEDTRRTSKLLAHYEIRKPLVSLHEHNEFREAPKLIERLAGGASIALVSDAGTPSVADPGARLVQSARNAGIPVVPIPGASAVATALSASGLDASHYVFRGFPPAKGQARQVWFESIRLESAIQVLFESPHRIRRTLSDLNEILAIRHIYVFRELTKINEESGIYPNIHNNDWPTERGEFTIVISPGGAEADGKASEGLDNNALVELFQQLSSAQALTREMAVELVAMRFGRSVAEVRKIVKKAVILAKQQSD
jgi:16S rRNA (cytidine1402-2'-O)-methyltransferase